MVTKQKRIWRFFREQRSFCVEYRRSSRLDACLLNQWRGCEGRINEVTIKRNENHATCLYDIKWLDFVGERYSSKHPLFAKIRGTYRWQEEHSRLLHNENIRYLSKNFAVQCLLYRTEVYRFMPNTPCGAGRLRSLFFQLDTGWFLTLTRKWRNIKLMAGRIFS